MSREEVELATRAARAVNARPKPDFATINEVFHPDHVFVPSVAQLEGEEYQGGRGYQRFLRQSGNVDAEGPLSWEADLEGAIDVGNHRVIGVATVRYRGTASGIEFEQRHWVVQTVRDGRITRTEIYTNPTEALKAALSE